MLDCFQISNLKIIMLEFMVLNYQWCHDHKYTQLLFFSYRIRTLISHRLYINFDHNVKVAFFTKQKKIDYNVILVSNHCRVHTILKRANIRIFKERITLEFA